LSTKSKRIFALGWLLLVVSCGRNADHNVTGNSEKEYSQIIKVSHGHHGSLKNSVWPTGNDSLMQMAQQIQNDLIHLSGEKVEVTPLLDNFDPHSTNQKNCSQLLAQHFVVKSHSSFSHSWFNQISYIENYEPDHQIKLTNVIPASSTSILTNSYRKKEWSKVIEQFELLSQNPSVKISPTNTYKLFLYYLEAYFRLQQFGIVIKKSLDFRNQNSDIHLSYINSILEFEYSAFIALVEQGLKSIENLEYFETTILNNLKFKHLAQYKMIAENKKNRDDRTETTRLWQQGKYFESFTLLQKEVKDQHWLLELFAPLILEKQLTHVTKSQFITIHRIVLIASFQLSENLLSEQLILTILDDPLLSQQLNFVSIYEKYYQNLKNVSLINRIERDVINKFPQSSLAQSLIKRFQNEEELKRAEEEKRLAKLSQDKRIFQERILTFSDPLNVNLWAMHSLIKIIKKPKYTFSKKFFNYSAEIIKAEHLRPHRYDIFLPEALKTMMIQTDGNPHSTTVAVIDSGLDFSHPDFQNQIYINAKEIPGNNIDDDQNGLIDDVSGFDFDKNSSHFTDDNGHGTHVAGTIGANFNGQGISGINPVVKILPIRVLNAEGSGSLSNVLRGVLYAHQQGSKVINLSLGSTYYSPLAEKVYECVYQNGSLVVAAAGNSNSFERHYPSGYNYVLSVGAIDYEGERARFSNLGADVDIAAPGVQILSTYPIKKLIDAEKRIFLARTSKDPYLELNGTSMSTPHVSGVASLLISTNPKFDQDELYARLLLGAKPLGSVPTNEPLGAGHLHADNSLTLNPRPFIKILSHSEHFQHEIETSNLASYDFSLELVLRNFWQAAKNVKIKIHSPSPDIVLEQTQREFSHWKNKEEKTVSLKGHFLKAGIESNFINFQLEIISDENFWVDDFQIKINPQFFRFHSMSLNRSTPDHSLWLPQWINWGVSTQISPVTGQIHSISLGNFDRSLGRQSNSVLSPSQVLTFSTFDIGNIHSEEFFSETLKGRPKVKQLATYGSFFNFILPLADYNLDGEYENLLVNTGYLYQWPNNQLINDKPAFILFNEDGEKIQDFPIALESFEKIESAFSLGPHVGLLIKVQSSNHSVLNQDDYQLKIFNHEFKNIGSHHFTANKMAPIITICRNNKTIEESKIILSFHQSEKEKNSKTLKPLNKNIIHVLNQNAELQFKNSRSGVVVRNLVCQDETIVTTEFHELESYQKNHRLLGMDTQLKDRWVHFHQASLSFQPLKVVTINKISHIVYNHEMDTLGIISFDGVELNTWRKKPFDHAHQSSFMANAFVYNQFLVIQEASNYLHLFNLNGDYLKTINVTGNYLNQGLIIDQLTDSGTRPFLFLTSEQGFHHFSLDQYFNPGNIF
jgi:hypothetical protein